MAKLVAFDLPFVIFVRDTMRDPVLDAWVEAVRSGQEPPSSPYAPASGGKLVIGSDLPVYVPPQNLGAPYVVNLGHRTVGLHLLRRVNQRKAIITAGEVLGDRTGRSSFSSVQCVISPLHPDDPHDDNECRFWEELAVDAVNHFISHYRVIAERPYVQTVTPAVIQEFLIGTDFGEGVERWVPTGRGSGHMKGFGGAIPAESDGELRQAVANTDPPAFTEVLRMEVQNHVDLRDWRMVVIETAVLFEVFIGNLIRFVAVKRGMPSSDVEALLTQPNGLPHNVEHLAKVVVADITGFMFREDHRFRDWKEKVATVRNDLVHGRRGTVTEAEAAGAFQAAIAARDVLHERCVRSDD